MVTDHLCWISLHFNLTTLKGGKKGREDGEMGGEEAIILRISVKGGDYSREAINREPALLFG